MQAQNNIRKTRPFTSSTSRKVFSSRLVLTEKTGGFRDGARMAEERISLAEFVDAYQERLVRLGGQAASIAVEVLANQGLGMHAALLSTCLEERLRWTASSHIICHFIQCLRGLVTLL